MPVKRYQNPEANPCSMSDCISGDWIQATDYDALLALAKEMGDGLRNAASIAHYRGVLRGASAFCRDSFEDCANCDHWRKLIGKWEAYNAK